MRGGSDKVGVASFTNFANLDQQLTGTFTTAKSALDTIVSGGDSYVGAGIDAGKNELLSTRANALATKVMVVLSDGTDSAAPLPGVTLSAAVAAKAAGIRVIAVHYGSGSDTLMKAIASSPSDYYSIR
jgi:Ca-activated chloride channel homolog